MESKSNAGKCTISTKEPLIMNPLCFVLMPFGEKKDAMGKSINFDEVYKQLIAPAIASVELEPLRADAELNGGIIHTPMFERLVLCQYAVGDLTAANANVYYELGVRHAARPATTVLIKSIETRLLFDAQMLRAIPYSLSSVGIPDRVEVDHENIKKRLLEAKKAALADSPVYELLKGYPKFTDADAESFHDRVKHALELQERIADARSRGSELIKVAKTEARSMPNEAGMRHIEDAELKAAEILGTVQVGLGSISACEPAVVLDLFLAYRAVEAWKAMISLFAAMSDPLEETIMVREQFALALNRDGQSERAEKILTDLLKSRGTSSETLGILGRVYKDRWEVADKVGRSRDAAAALDLAIDAYVRGFEADWRDYYPGINALTCMLQKTDRDPRFEQILPVVEYAVERNMASGLSNYWLQATRLELAVIARDQRTADTALTKALGFQPSPMERETTARNLRLLREIHAAHQAAEPWMLELENELRAS
jgi:hypothetical protein